MYTTPTWKANGEMDENTKVFLIAPTERQVEDIMFPEISRLFNRAKLNGYDLPGRLVGLGIRTNQKEWFMTGFKADDNNAVAWTGLHAANILFVVTEASGIKQLVFDGIEGNLHGNYRFLIVFNDNNGAGYAANTHKKPEWSKFRLDCLNAPNVAKIDEIRQGAFKPIPGQVSWETVNEKVKDWCEIINPADFSETEGDFWWENENGRFCYRPNDLFRVKVRGMAPKTAQDVLVPQEWVDAATERWKAHKAKGGEKSKPLRLGVDVAGMGRDSSAFCYRYGPYVEKFRLIQSGGVANHMEIAGITKTEIESNTSAFSGKYPQAFIDTVGEGAGVYSRLQELKVPNIHSVKGGAAASNATGVDYKDVTGIYTFKNLRAYLYWAVRDWLNPRNNTGAMLPPDADYRGLTELKWNMRSDGSIELESKEDLKKRTGKSPDEEDALAMTFYPVQDIDATVKSKRLKNFYPI